MEPVPASVGSRRGTHEPGIRAALRNHGPRAVGAGSVQLQRARYRQHGNHRTLRQRRAKAAMARTALARRDPLGVPDDGAGRSVVGCDEHSVQHYARWRQLCDRRPQMVVVGRGRSALQGLYRNGQDGPASAEASAAIDDPRPGGRERRHRASAFERLRLRRRAAWSHGHHAARTCACLLRISCSGRDAASRSRKDVSGRDAFTTACA